MLSAGAAGALLQTLSFALVIVDRDAPVGALALFGTALSSFTLLGLVIWISGRSQSQVTRPEVAPRAVSSAPASEEATGAGGAAQEVLEPSKATQVTSASSLPPMPDTLAPATDESPSPWSSSAEPRVESQSATSLEAIAHDINDLMTVVVTQSELLRERHAGREPEELEPILEAAHRLSGVARKLVAFAERQRLAVPVPARSIPAVGPGIARAPREPAAPARESFPSILDAVEAVRDESVVRESSPVVTERRRIGVARGVVLLVEDEQVLLRATRRMLEQREYRVLSASTGPAALELALQARGIDALITDLSLPGMNGMELARRLRWVLPGLPVLFMSGYDAAMTGLDLQDGGKGVFLQKPFTARELGERLEELFGPAEHAPLAQPG